MAWAASDAAFAPATARFAAARQAAGGAAFSYLFTAVPPLSEQALGAFHTSELPLAVRLVQHPECESVSRTVSAAWAAFARTGDPSTPSRPWTAGKRMILGGPPASTNTLLGLALRGCNPIYSTSSTERAARRLGDESGRQTVNLTSRTGRTSTL